MTIHNEGVVEQEKKNSKKRKRNVDAVKALTELVEKSDQQEIQDAKNADGDFHTNLFKIHCKRRKSENQPETSNGGQQESKDSYLSLK